MITDDIVPAGWKWSPDSSSIAYTTFSDNATGTALMLWKVADTDGTNPAMISDWVPGKVRWQWSPDGSLISWNDHTPPFRCNRLPDCTEPNQLWVADADGANPTKIAGFGQDLQGWMRWKWSPDGAYIAAWTDGGDQFWAADANGTNVTRITNTLPASSWWAGWSPDGSHIAISSGSSGSSWVANADGSNPTKLTDRGWLGPVSWSPDGSRIAYGSSSGKDNEPNQFWLANADGSNPTKLADEGGLVSWSPDGSRIAYGSSSGKDNEPNQLWVANADGSNPTKLADGGGSVSWSPDGTHLAWRIFIEPVDYQCGWPTRTVATQPESPTAEPLSVRLGRRTVAFRTSEGHRQHGARKPWRNESWVSDLDGTNQVRLWAGSRSGDNLGCAPHPSDTHYACETLNGDIGGHTGRLGFVRADGTILAEFTGFRAVIDRWWSRDHTHFVWIVQLPGDSGEQLWVANADGSNPTKLTDNADYFLGFRRLVAG